MTRLNAYTILMKEHKSLKTQAKKAMAQKLSLMESVNARGASLEL